MAGVHDESVRGRAGPAVPVPAVSDAVPADADHRRDGARRARDRRRKAGAHAGAAAGDAGDDLELLVAKVLGALLPTLAISLAGLALYFAGIAAVRRAGRRCGDGQRRARSR